MEPNKISVVIVTFRRAESLRQLLAGLCGPVKGLQIIVVDNGSRDETSSLDAEFPTVRFTHLQRNFGLTRALNIGIRSADGEYVLLLHDDVNIDGAAAVALADFLKAGPTWLPFVHVSTARRSARFRHRLIRTRRSRHLSQQAILSPSGFGRGRLVRIGFLRSMGHIDERYGNYGSEIEICAQVKSSGRKLVILPAVAAQHNPTPSPVPAGYLEGDRVAGTSAYLSKHFGLAAGTVYRLKTSLKALITLRFRVLAAAEDRADRG